VEGWDLTVGCIFFFFVCVVEEVGVCCLGEGGGWARDCVYVGRGA